MASIVLVPVQENPGSEYDHTVLATKLEQSAGIVAVIELYVTVPKSTNRLPVRFKELPLNVPVAPTSPLIALVTEIALSVCVIVTSYASVSLHSEVAELIVSKMLQPPLISPIGGAKGTLLPLSLLLHDVMIKAADTANIRFNILYLFPFSLVYCKKSQIN